MEPKLEKIALEKFKSQEIVNLNCLYGGAVEAKTKTRCVEWTECDANDKHCQDKIITVERDDC